MQPADPPRELARVLGAFHATCVVIGAIIGVGIFFSPGGVARIAGSPQLALLAWAVGGLIALVGALTFAELGVRYPNAGGQYEILRDVYGPAPAFLFVFCNATAVQAGAIAAIATVCGEYASVALVGHGMQAPYQIILATVLVCGLVAANSVGVRWGAGVQNATVLAKVATLAAVGALAIFGAPAAPAPAPASAPGASGMSVIALFAAIVPAFFAYGGWQHALWMAGEVREPSRNLPRAIIGGVALVVVVYLVANWAYLRLLGYAGVAESPALAADAVAVAWPGGRRVMAGAVAISAFGVLNAQLLSGPRLIYRMALDGRFWAPFANVSPRCGTPAKAILLLGAAALVLLFLSNISADAGRALDQLVNGVVFVDGIFFLLTGAAVFALRRRAGAGGPRGGAFGYPLAPLIFVLGELGILAGACAERSTQYAALAGAGWIVVGGLLFFIRFRKGG
jgi:amino acid transporter